MSELNIILMWMIFGIIVINGLLILFVSLILRLAFYRRFDPHPKLKYFTVDDFPGVDMDPVEFRHPRGYHLRGGIYYYDRIPRKKEVIIFSHGIGSGHQGYTHLLMAFVRQGYIVFAYDHSGCALSEGKAIFGIPQAVIDLKTALGYLSTTIYRDFRWHLLGHSWGAYTVLRAAKMAYPIRSIVSICPFDDVTEMLSRYLPWMRLLKPWIKVSSWFAFGRWGVLTTTQILATTKIPILVISGEWDEDVPLKGNYDRFLSEAKHNPLVTVYLAKGRRHNPYLSLRAENYVIDTILKGTQAIAKERDPIQQQQFFDQIDYQWVGEHDSEIIQMIIQFFHR